MRTVVPPIFLLIALASIANSAPVSEADLNSLPAQIRQNRSTQAHFQEQRVIRLMKKPILSSGKVWFQPPNKFRREVYSNQTLAIDLISTLHSFGISPGLVRRQ
jgi:outer membrane lipoprotein-sorting protein